MATVYYYENLILNRIEKQVRIEGLEDEERLPEGVITLRMGVENVYPNRPSTLEVY